MTAPLCDAVLATSGAADSLDALARSNAFVVPLDDRREWYRYHHLFGDLLRRELERHHPDMLPVYLARAAGWCERHGSPGEAFAYAHASGDLAQAGRIALGHWDELAGRGQIETLRLWLDRCTDEEIESDAQLSIAASLGRRAARPGGPGEAVRRCGRAEPARRGIRRRVDIAALRTRECPIGTSLPTESTGCCVTPSSSTPRRSRRAPGGCSAPVVRWGRRTCSWAGGRRRSMRSARRSR